METLEQGTHKVKSYTTAIKQDRWDLTLTKSATIDDFPENRLINRREDNEKEFNNPAGTYRILYNGKVKRIRTEGKFNFVRSCDN